MKYVVVLGDGMADRPIAELGDQTPLSYADTPEMDQLMKWCVETSKDVAPNRLYTDNSSNGEHRNGDFATCHPYYQVNCYEDMLNGWIQKRGDQPLILGEFADISVLRDLTALKEKESPDYSW